MPQMKDLVPSIGSSTQTYSASGRSAAEFLADHAVLGKGPLDQSAHGGFGGAVGGGDRIEAAGAAFILDAQRAAEERPDGLAGNGGEFVHKGREIDRRHDMLRVANFGIGALTKRQSGRRCPGTKAVNGLCKSNVPVRHMAGFRVPNFYAVRTPYLTL